MTHDLGPAVDQLLTLAHGVRPADLPQATPNEGRTVEELLGHLVGLTAAFRAAADKDLGPLTDTNPDGDGWPTAEPGWLDVLAARGAALVRAGRSPPPGRG